MSERIEAYNKAKSAARKCGVTGIQLRAVIDWANSSDCEEWLELAREQPEYVDVEKSRKAIVKLIKDHNET